MEENLHILKEIGAQQIHKDTHISKEHVQAIIHGSFEGMNPVQLVGFISILEREYKLDLTELKKTAKEHVSDAKVRSVESKKVFTTPKQKNTNPFIYIVLALIIFVAAAYYSFGYLSSMATSTPQIDNSTIEDAQKSIEATSEEKVSEEVDEASQELSEASVLETIETATVSEANEVIEPLESISEQATQDVQEEVRTLKILPKNKIWAGYIDIETNQKYQKIFRKEFAIDVSKNWLLLFGSGTVYLEVNGENQKYSSNQNMRFKYVDGELTKITVTEFKSLNKGKKW